MGQAVEVDKLFVRGDELQPLGVQMQLTPALTARAFVWRIHNGSCQGHEWLDY